MTLTDFYLICFLVGFLLSVVAVLTGDMHIADLHVHDLNLHLPHLHVGGADGGADVPLFSFATIAAFLAWFGGTGYLLAKFSSIWVLLAFGIAGVSGVGGAAIVFLFLAKVLMRREENLDPADYEMVGVLGKLTVPIRTGGTGEIVFTQGGTRHCLAARSESGEAVPKGAEVVVTQYEKGIAYVRRWEELSGA